MDQCPDELRRFDQVVFDGASDRAEPKKAQYQKRTQQHIMDGFGVGPVLIVMNPTVDKAKSQSQNSASNDEREPTRRRSEREAKYGNSVPHFVTFGADESHSGSIVLQLNMT